MVLEITLASRSEELRRCYNGKGEDRTSEGEIGQGLCTTYGYLDARMEQHGAAWRACRASFPTRPSR